MSVYSDVIIRLTLDSAGKFVLAALASDARHGSAVPFPEVAVSVTSGMFG